MTPEQFIAVQTQLASAFAPFIYWWLVALLVSGVIAVMVAGTLVILGEMVSKF
jgi:hypothetical protein